MKKINTYVVLIICLINNLNQSIAQTNITSEVELGATVLVNAPEEDYPHFEAHLAINPIDDSNVIITSIAIHKGGEGGRIKVFSSEDGGRSWSTRSIDGSPVKGGDPYLAFDKAGTAYLVYLPYFVRKSKDGGKSWSSPVKLPLGPSFSGEDYNSNLDYTKIIVDNTDGKFSGRVYVTAVKTDRLTPKDEKTIVSATLMYSLDQAQSFSFPTHMLPGNLNYGQGSPAIFSDGTILFPFMPVTKAGLSEPLESSRLWITRSLDGGNSFETPRLVREDFFGMKPDIAVDLSDGEYKDHVYMTWSTGEKYDFNILLNWSDDKGITWNEPVRVNEGKQVTWTQKPAIAVNKNGTVGLLWMQISHNEEGNCFTPYFAYSRDRGKSIVNVPLFNTPICNNTEANRIPISDSGLTVFDRWSRGGDYYGIDTFDDGSFGVVWADSRSGVYQLYFRRIVVY